MQHATRLGLTFTLFIFSAVFHCVFAQLAETEHFSSQHARCSESITLDSTGHFFKESACAGRANISFGRYTMGREQKIRFYFLPFDSIAPIGRIVSDKIVMEYDSIVTVTFYDRFKQPLASNFAVRAIDQDNKLHEMSTDENGQVEVNRFRYSKVVLMPLLSIYGPSASVDLARECLSVYLNLPRIFLDTTEATVEKGKKMILQLKHDGLYMMNANVLIYKRD